MADNLSSEFDALLRPQRLVTARDFLTDRTLVPDVGGIYGWWFNCSVSNVPLEGTLTKDGYRLLYVGIAPRKPSAAGQRAKARYASASRAITSAIVSVVRHFAAHWRVC